MSTGELLLRVGALVFVVGVLVWGVRTWRELDRLERELRRDGKPGPCKVCRRVAPLVLGECPDCRHFGGRP